MLRIGSNTLIYRVMIKRESGESPEQSRCCKFRKMLRTELRPLERIREGVHQQKQVRRPAMHTLITAFEERARKVWEEIIQSKDF